MVYGGPAKDRLQFNEDTLWAGGPRSYAHPGAAKYLGQIRQLLLDGKQREAERLASRHFMSVPLRQLPYQPFGDVELEFDGHDHVDGYRRSLDLETAICRTQYKLGGGAFQREVFASHPDRVLLSMSEADAEIARDAAFYAWYQAERLGTREYEPPPPAFQAPETHESSSDTGGQGAP